MLLIQYIEVSRDSPLAYRAHGLYEGEGLTEDIHLFEKNARGIVKFFFVIDLPALANGNLLTNRISMERLISMYRYQMFFFVCHDNSIRQE